MHQSLHRNQIAAYLFNKLATLAPWPAELLPVPTLVDGTAFFPGGAGLWQESSATTSPDIMVIGQDFSTFAEHADMLAGQSRDIDSKTWVNFRALASTTGLDLCRCFFTNAVMGLRAYGSSEGPNPGYHRGNLEFMQRSQEFLSLQISVLRPKLILVLGLRAAVVLSACTPELKEWSLGKHKPIDDSGRAFFAKVRISDVEVPIALLTHPSRWYRNVQLRRYGGMTGREAEYALLQDAIAAVG
ncbi:hypothetical protein [Noviherbaspirillum suwonense]|uniref:Uracil DNA glycosylase superfamily protein n=1 Tax=Noviherbaspirillum suwonense TaxID=1224511 RepID=A0ABY1QU55_9BURK|nr:hypothetical protein [Noviherbaspirillum suwonense]SMP80307.1 Uracil DNA glycosylase superfamily protein [Noviherbaspirillum suwonense]